jgi:predicted ATPase
MNEWLEFLEAATTIETRDKGRLGFELVVTQPGLSHGVDLTYVGVGVSQVVPVILTCLLSRPGSVVLLEQPELHLHPAMQQRLGDFLLALARTGRQLVVETHSEYLVTRLRRRIAEDPGDDTARMISIFNVSKDTNGRTHCSNIGVDRSGSFERWPEGFFDQASGDAERLLAAGLEKSSKPD